MSKEALEIILDAMETLGINYAFMGIDIEKDRDGNPIYPYFVGEYQEMEPMYETGQQDSVFMLTGYTRGEWLDLEDTKEKIKNYFNKVGGKTVIADNGSAVAIFYATSLVVPTGDAELKKIQINLDVKEWSVN